MASRDTTPQNAPAQQPPVPVDAGPSPLEQIVEQNKSKLGIAVVAILLAICAFFLFRHLAKQKEDNAAVAFTSAQTVEELTAVLEEHSGTIGAGNAHLRLADLLARRGETQEALKSLQTFVDSYKGHPRHAQGLVAIGTIHHEAGDLDKAEASLQDAIAQYPSADVAPLAKLRLGDIAWARGDKEKARQFYEQIPPAHMASPYISRIDERIRLLREEPPSEPSERQKQAVEEERLKREAEAEAARKAAEERATQGPDGSPLPAPDIDPTTIEAPSLLDDGAVMPDEPGASLIETPADAPLTTPDLNIDPSTPSPDSDAPEETDAPSAADDSPGN